MTIVDQLGGAVVRGGIHAATSPPRAAPPRHPGTVAVQEGKVIQGTPPRQQQSKPVDGALLWALVNRYLAYYVAFRTKEEMNRGAAWTFHACARRRGELGMGPLIWNATPRLLIKSRTRGAGKSTLLDLLVFLTGSRRGKTPRITPARLAQIIGQAHEAVFVDEGRLVFGAGARHEDLQACLLVGYTPNGSYEVSKTSLSVFGPVAIATKESLLTEASKAVDGDESSLGDLLDRCLTITLSAPDFPMPEVGKRARAEGEMLARALVAWTDTYRDALEQAAEDIADEDHEAAVARAERGEKATETPRALQIGRPLRAVGRVIDQQVIAEARRRNAANPDPDYTDPEPQVEAEILACLGTQAEDIMSELEQLSQGWGDPQFAAEDEDSDGDEYEADGDEAAQQPPGPPLEGFEAILAAIPAPPSAAADMPADGSYVAVYAVKQHPGHRPDVHRIGGPWPGRDAAMAACENIQAEAAEDTAWEPITWLPSQHHANMWGATISPAGQEWPQVSYAVSMTGQ